MCEMQTKCRETMNEWMNDNKEEEEGVAAGAGGFATRWGRFDLTDSAVRGGLGR